MAVGHWIVILLFGGVFLFGAVLGIHLRGFAKGYREGLEDGIKACGAGEQNEK